MEKQFVILSAIAGISSTALTLFIGVLPNAYSETPHKIWVSLIWLSISLLIVSGFWLLLVISRPLKEKILQIFTNRKLHITRRKSDLIPLEKALYIGHYSGDFHKLQFAQLDLNKYGERTMKSEICIVNKNLSRGF